jgi:hypothetical protein
MTALKLKGSATRNDHGFKSCMVGYRLSHIKKQKQIKTRLDLQHPECVCNISNAYEAQVIFRFLGQSLFKLTTAKFKFT